MPAMQAKFFMTADISLSAALLAIRYLVKYDYMVNSKHHLQKKQGFGHQPVTHGTPLL